jgi:hypothetical protein
LILKHKTNNKIHTTTTTKKDLLCRQDWKMLLKHEKI